MHQKGEGRKRLVCPCIVHCMYPFRVSVLHASGYSTRVGFTSVSTVCRTDYNQLSSYRRNWRACILNVRYAGRLPVSGSCVRYTRPSPSQLQPSVLWHVEFAHTLLEYIESTRCISCTYVSAVLCLHSVHAPNILVRLPGQLQQSSDLSNSRTRRRCIVFVCPLRLSITRTRYTRPFHLFAYRINHIRPLHVYRIRIYVALLYMSSVRDTCRPRACIRYTRRLYLSVYRISYKLRLTRRIRT